MGPTDPILWKNKTKKPPTNNKKKQQQQQKDILKFWPIGFF